MFSLLVGVKRLALPFLVAAAVAVTGAAGPAQHASRVLNPGGFAAIDWLFAASDKDLYDMWAEHGDPGKLRGSVVTYLDWPNVSSIVVLYNGWHLLGTDKDMRIQHLQDNLGNAAFGDRFKGSNPGGAYVLLLEYRNSDRKVVVGFKDGVFLIEGIDGIGAVDVRRTR
jgi:hypothetical protein